MDIQNNQAKFLDITTKIKVNYDELKTAIEQNTVTESSENEVYFKLTPASLLEYGEGKEQYVIIDTSDKVYVQSEDMNNYISSKNLMEFLGKYGIVDYSQIEEIYNNLYSTETQSVAMTIEDLQKNKPQVNDKKYWAKETENTVEKQIYTNMIDKVSAALNNASQMYCSCCFYIIADMLSYTDVTKVTENEIYNAFKEFSGIEYGDVDYMKQQLENLYNNPESSAPITTENEKTQNVEEIDDIVTTNEEIQEVKIENKEIKNDEIEKDEIPSQNIIEPVITQSRKTENVSVTSTIGKNFDIPVQKISINFEKFLHVMKPNKIDFKLNDDYVNSLKQNINSLTSMARHELYAADRMENLNSDIDVSEDIMNLSTLSTEAKRLFSNYLIDENGNYTLSSDGERQLKTLRQKIIDVYHIAQNYNELGVEQGNIENNKGDRQNKETDLTVRGAIKSVKKDIQKALNVESFDYDSYLADYSEWTDKYAEQRAIYDNQTKLLQEKQVPEDLSKAVWYSNLWSSMGGKDTKLGENISMNIVTNDINHEHQHGNYDNEISCSFDIPDSTSFKGKDLFVVLTSEQADNENWLKNQLQNKKIIIEKYNNKQNVNEKLLKSSVSEHNNTVQTQQNNSDLGKQMNSLKEMLDDKNKFNNLM